MLNTKLNYLLQLNMNYKCLLINKLTPLIFSGYVSLYKKSIKYAEDNDSDKNHLETFKEVLENIPELSNIKIMDETTKIKSKCSFNFDDLVKVIIKSNIIIFNSFNHSNKVDENYHNNIDINTFIHNIYKESSKFLIHNIVLFEKLNTNNHIIFEFIEKGINNAILLLLPTDIILSNFLNSSGFNYNFLVIQRDINGQLKDDKELLEEDSDNSINSNIQDNIKDKFDELDKMLLNKHDYKSDENSDSDKNEHNERKDNSLSNKDSDKTMKDNSVSDSSDLSSDDEKPGNMQNPIPQPPPMPPQYGPPMPPMYQNQPNNYFKAQSMNDLI